MPDAPGFTPPADWMQQRADLKMRVACLAGSNAQLKRSLRELVNMTTHASDNGTADWYQRALAALNVAGAIEDNDGPDAAEAGSEKEEART